MAVSHGPRASDISYLAGLLRDRDRPRYYATLFAPEPLRADLFALYGFAAEIERIPAQVRETMLGRIRLQWWRDALEEPDADGAENPALRAVRSALGRHSLSAAPLRELIEAREADLYSDPPATLAELAEQIGKTESSLFQLGAAMSGAAGPQFTEAAGHAGIAYGIARRLADFAADRARGRTVLPRDLLAIEGLQPGDVFARPPDAGLHNVIRALSDLSRQHLRTAQTSALPRRSVPVFSPLAVVAPLLSRVDRLGRGILEQNAALSDLEMLLRIGWARMKGAF